MTIRHLLVFGAAMAALTLAACQPYQQAESTTEDRQQAQTNAQINEADRQTGFPAVTHYQERKDLKQIYEDRDAALTTFVYTQDINGRFICMGHAIGYGVPYGTQMTNPQKLAWANWEHTSPSYYLTGTLPQAEPNGLYSPASAEGTWVRMVDPSTKKAQTVYVEPRITVSPFPLTGPSVAVACSK